MADLQPFRLETALKLGAEHAIDVRKDDPLERVMELTGGLGADYVIECVGHYHELPGRQAPLADAVRMIRNGGRVVTAGLGEPLSAVHFKTLVIREGSIVATRVTAGEFSRALRLMAKGLLHPELLITHQLPAREITQAFATVDRDEPSTIKVVLDVQQM